MEIWYTHIKIYSKPLFSKIWCILPLFCIAFLTFHQFPGNKKYFRFDNLNFTGFTELNSSFPLLLCVKFTTWGGLLIKNPPPTSSTPSSEKQNKNLTCYRWHVTHMTRGMWHATHKGEIWLTHWINQLINYKGVFRTAPATPGLLNRLKCARRLIPLGLSWYYYYIS